MKRVFISQPVANRTPESIEDERKHILEKARDTYGENEKIIEIPCDDRGRSKDPVSALGQEISLMARSDLVLFAPGWQYDRGCRIEHRVCLDFGLNHLDLDWKWW